MTTRDTVRTVAIVAAAVALVAAVVLAAQSLLVLFGGYLYALVLRSISAFASRKTRLPYAICLTVIVVAVVGCGVAMVAFAGPTIRDQLIDLAARLPEAAKNALAKLRALPATNIFGPAPSPKGPETSELARSAFSAVGTTIEVLGGLVVIFFVGVYGAARPKDYSRAVLVLTPHGHRVRIGRVMKRTSGNLSRWLLGRLVAMLFVGITCAIAFTILKVPLALTLAVVAGLLTFVEYVGALASAVPPVLLALTQSTTTALGVLIVFTVLHVIEGYLLTPLLARASVRIPPAVTLAGQLVFAAVVGPLGLTFSTPLLVIVVSTLETLRGKTRRKRKATDETSARRRSQRREAILAT